MKSYFIPKIILQLACEMWSGYKEKLPAVEKNLQSVVERILTAGHALIFSCSERWDCVPMWAHYTDNHRGFVFGFDPKSAFSFTTPKGKTSALVPVRVEYRDTIPKRMPRVGKMEFAYLRRMTPWAYEREWRYINIEENLVDTEQKDSSGYNIFVQALDRSAIREIIFGYLCPEATRQALMRAAEAVGADVTFFELLRRDGRYGFERRRVLPDAPAAPLAIAKGAMR